jgi:hypothetical protein
MLSRTNGWQRIGIVLSVVWLIAACSLVLVVTTSHSGVSPFLSISSAHCQPGAPQIPSSQKHLRLSEAVLGCPEKYIVSETQSINWPSTLAFLFCPIFLVWGLAFALVRTIRWVAAGFRKRSAPSLKRTASPPLNSSVRRTHKMSFLAKLKQRINRDDGRYYQIGNRPLGALEVAGLLVFVGALVLWQLHDKTGISSIWALAAGVVGLLLIILGKVGKRGGPHA